MLVVDTNVVVRYLTGDHPAQARMAERVVRDHDIGLSGTVMLETEWVLRSLYRYPRTSVHAGLQAFVGLENVHVANPEGIAAALAWFAKGMDFADAMHLTGCEVDDVFATFDRKLKATATKVAAGKVKLLRA